MTRTMLAEHWTYRSEGGANIVVAYCGPTPSAFEGKVLRLRKIKHAGSSRLPTSHVIDERHSYSRAMMLQMLGVDGVLDMERVEVERSFLEEMRHRLEKELVRPRERAEVDMVDVESESVIVMDDMAYGGNTVTFEIKPKWGFIPSPTNAPSLSPLDQPPSTQCRFCKHQIHKRHLAGKIPIDPISTTTKLDNRYCPLDLYSEDVDRKRQGLQGLCRRWKASGGSANNLKIFHGLQGIVLPTDLTALDRLARYFGVETDSISMAIEDILTPILSSSPILATLRHLQSTFDPIGIEGIAALFFARTGCALDSISLSDFRLQLDRMDLQQPTADEWDYFYARWSFSGDHSLSDLLLAYLISATFKDCSIFIRLDRCPPPSPSPPPPTSAPSSRRATCRPSLFSSIKVIDVDPKLLERIPYYCTLDLEIAASFRVVSEEHHIPYCNA